MTACLARRRAKGKGEKSSIRPQEKSPARLESCTRRWKEEKGKRKTQRSPCLQVKKKAYCTRKTSFFSSGWERKAENHSERKGGGGEATETQRSTKPRPLSNIGSLDAKEPNCKRKKHAGTASERRKKGKLTSVQGEKRIVALHGGPPFSLSDRTKQIRVKERRERKREGKPRRCSRSSSRGNLIF